jgi:A/G-specific adenine glycosylase
MTSIRLSSAIKSRDLLRFDKNWFHRQIVFWFRENKRDLPWRKTSDPYLIWIAELMCQQTGVSTAVPFFERFVRRFPSIQSLSKASEFEVLQLWQGLGYYQRAKNLFKAAKILTEHHGGRLPNSKADLLKIPGIGQYTAGAILSIAHSLSTPALDGNLIRVYSRFFGLKEPVDEPKVLRQLWANAQGLASIRKTWVRDFTEGLMELGALVCRPRSPRCYQCPIRSKCVAFNENLTTLIPVKMKKMQRVKLIEWVYFFCDQGKVGIFERGADKKYPDFQRLPFEVKTSAPRSYDVRMRYSVTHRDFEVFVLRKRPRANLRWRWVSIQKLEKILMPAIDRKILKKEMPLAD